jgi:hypothetical protein
MTRIAIIAAMTLAVAACSSAKPTPLPSTTIAMKVVERSDAPRPFSVTLSDGSSPSQRVDLSGRGRDRSSAPCPGGPFRLKQGRTVQVRVNRVKLASGTVRKSIDKAFLRRQYCPSLIARKVVSPTW